MPFANIDSTSLFPQAKRAEFLTLKPGQTIVRILDKGAVIDVVHYVEGATVLCIEEGCPVCQSNERLIADNPETYKNIKSFSPKLRRCYTNVLDRTLSKTCPACETEVKRTGNSFPASCPNCNTILIEIKEEPSNKVRVLARGVQLFEQFNALEESVLDDAGNPLPITAYDIVLSVSGTGRQTKVTAIPLANKRDPVELEEGTLYDLSKITIKLTAEELIDLQKGISLRDIFAARGNSKEEVAEEEVGEEVTVDAEQAVKELFGEG